MARLSLEEKRAQLKAQLADLDARASKERRRLDARQKIIIGATVQNAMANDSAFAGQVRELLNKLVTKEKDREAIAPWLSIT